MRKKVAFVKINILVNILFNGSESSKVMRNSLFKILENRPTLLNVLQTFTS